MKKMTISPEIAASSTAQIRSFPIYSAPRRNGIIGVNKGCLQYGTNTEKESPLSNQ